MKALQQLGSEQATANAAIEAQAAMIEAQVIDTTLSINLAFPFLVMVVNCIAAGVMLTVLLCCVSQSQAAMLRSTLAEHKDTISRMRQEAAEQDKRLAAEQQEQQVRLSEGCSSASFTTDPLTPELEGGHSACECLSCMILDLSIVGYNSRMYKHLKIICCW